MSGLATFVNKVKKLFSEIMYAIVGKAAKNRDEFLDTVEEGKEVVGDTEESWEGVIFVLTMVGTVLLQFIVLHTPVLNVVAKAVIVFALVWAQVKIITLHFKANRTTPLDNG